MPESVNNISKFLPFKSAFDALDFSEITRYGLVVKSNGQIDWENIDNGPSPGLTFKVFSGTFSGTEMTGTPLEYEVTLPETLTNYIVLVESETPRDWTVTDKTTTTFKIQANASTGIDDIITWNAQELINGDVNGSLVGPQGPEGPQGATGPEGPIGPTGPTGQQTLSDTLLLGNTTSVAIHHNVVTDASVSGTYELNMNDANVFDLTLTGDTTLDYVNEAPGSYIIQIKQDATGGRTLSFADNKFIADVVPTISSAANSISLIQLLFISNKAIVISIQNLIIV